MIGIYLLLVLSSVQARPQQCDGIFEVCDPEPEDCSLECDPDDVFCELCDPECDPNDVLSDRCEAECFDNTIEIDDAVFTGDTRQAFSPCDTNKKCEDFSEAGYVCAPSWTCANNTIITDGTGLIDVRSDDFCSETSGIILDASDTTCKDVDHVCCKKPNFKKPKPPPVCRSNDPSDLSRCGRSSSSVTITGLEENSLDAQPGEFVHMCVIYRFEQGQRIYVGGASLIARNKVITIAHKFYVKRKRKTTDWRDNTSDFVVRCGEHNVRTEIDLLNSQETQVEKIIIHPQYDARRVYFNLAILQTKENFVYQKDIGPVCLPRPFQSFDGQRDCWSSGWGADEYNSVEQFGDSLKKVQMPIVPTPECERRMKKTPRFRNKPGFRIHDSWICIGGEKGSDTCKGDGGSPHVCKDEGGGWVQVGAVAWGVGCGDAVPAVYSSIPYAMCWIDWVMSCVPLSNKDVDGLFVDDLDIRGTNVDSINELTYKECGEWMENSFELKDICVVDYQFVDERSGK